MTILRNFLLCMLLFLAGFLAGCESTSPDETTLGRMPASFVSAAVDSPLTPPPVPTLSQRERKFDRDIAAFIREQQEQTFPKGAVLFTGSSSIRKWETLSEDMAPIPVINRGFGGSTLRQVHHYAPKIILPHQPRLVVLYAGENDIANDVYGAEVAVEDFDSLVAYLHYYLPQTPILYLSMKPSPARWEYWPKFQAANAAIAEMCARDPLVEYLEVSEVMLNNNGEPKSNIWVRDRLHMNDTGYAEWTQLIRPKVMQMAQVE